MFEEYVRVCDQIAALNEKRTALRDKIIEAMGSSREATIDGFSLKLVSALRRTLMKKLVEEKFGIVIPDECFKSTAYDMLHVSKLIG